MPKMKTKKAVAKRFKRTGSGKIVHKQRAQHHLAMQKTSRRLRKLGATAELKGKDRKNIDELLP